MTDAGFADGFADGDGDVRMRSVAPRRAATAAAAARRAAPRSRAAEITFTNLIHVKALSRVVHAKKIVGDPEYGVMTNVTNGQLQWGQ